MDSQIQQVLINIIDAVPMWAGAIILILIAAVWFFWTIAPMSVTDSPWFKGKHKDNKRK